MMTMMNPQPILPRRSLSASPSLTTPGHSPLKFGEDTKPPETPPTVPTPDAPKTHWTTKAIAPVLTLLALAGAGTGIKVLVDMDEAQSAEYRAKSAARDAARDAEYKERAEADRRSDILRLQMQSIKDPKTKMTVLATYMNDPSPSIRTSIVKMVAELNIQTQVAGALGIPANLLPPDTRTEALQNDFFKKMALDSSPSVKVEVIRAIGSIPSDTLRSDILKALHQDASSEVRQAVASSVSTLQQEQTKFDILSVLVLDREREVRTTAMGAAKSLKSEAMKKELFLRVLNQK